MRQNLIFFISFSNFTIWQPWYLGLGQEKFQKIISAIIDKNTLLDTWLEGFSPVLDCKCLFLKDFKPVAKSHFSHAHFY